MRNFSMLALVVVGLIACRGDDTGDDQPMPDGGGNTNDVTIQEIQNDAMPACNPADPTTCVEIKVKGVIVTAIDTYGMRTGDFWVSEPDGGPFSGIKVYNAPLDQVGALVVGDVVDITGGVKDEFALMEDTSGRKVTEIKPVPGGMLTVTKVGTGTLPTPSVVDAASLATKTAAEQDMEWEKWEGVLITVTNAKQISDIKTFGAGSDDQKEFDIAAGEVAVQSALTALPTSAVANTCYAGITGIGDYFFNYLVFPRSESDLMGGGTGCAATTTTTIMEIQTASTPPTGTVELKGVCVVALSRPVGMPASPKHLWVQASDTVATLNNGLYIYGPGGDMSAFAPGTKVNVLGTVKEFNDSMNVGTGTLTEIAATSVTAAAGTCTPTPILDQSAEALSMDANGEPAESVLVELKNVQIATAADPMYYAGQMKQGNQTFKFDDDSFRITTAASTTTCYTFKGIWSYQVYDNAWQFLPIAAGATTTCP